MNLTANGDGHHPALPEALPQPAGEWDVRTDARLDLARQWLDSGGSVLIHGPSRTVLSAALGVVAGSPAGRTLACRTRPAGRRRRYAVLRRLLASMSGGDLELVPKARQEVLIALVAGEAEELPPPVVRVAVLDLLRRLARRQPVLLVIDGVHDVDPGSAAVLADVLSQVDDLPVQVAVAELTPGSTLPRHHGLCPSPLLIVRAAAVSG